MDSDATIHPGEQEFCDDDIDNDCDGDNDCEDSGCYNDPACQSCTNADSDGYYAESGCGTDIDCNDEDPDIYPLALELCDEKDNQCWGDEGYGIVDEKCAICGLGYFASCETDNQ